MRIATLIRLAVSGTRTDTVRVTLTTLGSAAAVFGWLCAATVAALGLGGSDLGSAGDNPEYTTSLLREPGLRPGVIATLVLLTIPVLALVAQCSRLGAPARDRRIAAMRLAGATPRQAVAIGAAESGAASVLGSAAGLATYLILRRLLDSTDGQGLRTLPTDVLPAVWSIATICVALPAIVTLASAWMLRRVSTTPLGVVRRARRRHAPRPWPALLIAAGIAVFAGFRPVARSMSRHHVQIPPDVELIVFYVGVLAAAFGVAMSAGWLAYAAGRLLRRFGRRAPGQLAAARLIADPWQGSRTFGVLIVAALFGGGTAAVYANFVAMFAVNDAANRASDPNVGGFTDNSYTGAVALVGVAIGFAVLVAALGQLVTISEAIVSRRRTYAALVATGVPRGALARMTAWQALAVATPALVLAAAAGEAIPRALMGTTVTVGGGYSIVDGVRHDSPVFVQGVPIPWAQLGLVIGGSLIAVLLTVGIGLLFLKASTSVEELRTG